MRLNKLVANAVKASVTTVFVENSVPMGEGDQTGADKPLVSVVILLYKSRRFITACLESLARQTWPRHRMELVLVDNGSRDGGIVLARDVMKELGLWGALHYSKKNLGCAGGNNVGWCMCHGQVVVFLNPDTELEPNCLEELVKPLLEDEWIGVTGAKMYFPGPDKIIQHAGGIVHPNGMTNHHGAGRRDEGQWDEMRDVDYVTGAALAIRAEVMLRLRAFDEDYYPAYYEEVDLCLRVRRLGLRVVYTPQAVLVHHESVGLGKGSARLHRLFPRMRIRYLIKNLTPRQIVGWALPFEWRWMRHEPQARGYRLKQVVYGWLWNVPWVAYWLICMRAPKTGRGISSARGRLPGEPRE